MPRACIHPASMYVLCRLKIHLGNFVSFDVQNVSHFKTSLYSRRVDMHRPSFLISPLNGILCPHKTNECKFLLAGYH